MKSDSAAEEDLRARKRGRGVKLGSPCQADLYDKSSLDMKPKALSETGRGPPWEFTRRGLRRLSPGRARSRMTDTDRARTHQSTGLCRACKATATTSRLFPRLTTYVCIAERDITIS